MNILDEIANLSNLEQDKFDNETFSFFAKDLEGKFIYLNSFVTKICGVSKKEDLIGLTDFDLDFYPAKATELVVENDHFVIAKDKSQLFIERANTFDGNQFLAITRKKPLRSIHNKIVGTVGVAYFIYENNVHLGHRQMLDDISNAVFIGANDHYSYGLTHRQKQIITYLLKGLSLKQIALKLHLSPRTVEHHIETIKDKMKVSTRTDIVDKTLLDHAFVIQLGMI